MLRAHSPIKSSFFIYFFLSSVAFRFSLHWALPQVSTTVLHRFTSTIHAQHYSVPQSQSNSWPYLQCFVYSLQAHGNSPRTKLWLSTLLLCHFMHFSNILLPSSRSFSRVCIMEKSVCLPVFRQGTSQRSAWWSDLRGFACHRATRRYCIPLQMHLHLI